MVCKTRYYIITDNSLQDCDRTFNKERQYSSHIKKCTKVSVHDLSGARQEIGGAEEEEEEPEPQEDPFADPDPLPAPARRGRGPGRRGRPPGRGSHTTSRVGARNSAQLFDGSRFDGDMSLFALNFTDISTNQ